MIKGNKNHSLMKFLMSPTRVNSLDMTNHCKVTVICGKTLIKGSNLYVFELTNERNFTFFCYIYLFLVNKLHCPREPWVIPPAIWVYKLTNFHIQFIKKLSDHYLSYSFRHIYITQFHHFL